MKFNRPSTRRKPVRKKLSARLFNKTATRKQRASAATQTAEDMEGSGINISRSLSIIFAIHIVAIGMIFIHKQYLVGRTTAPEAAKETSKRTPNNSLPQLSNGDKTILPKAGDNYSVIAARYGVEESALRTANRNADIRPGMVIRIPEGNRIVAETPPEEKALRNQAPLSPSDQGLVEILPPVSAPRAQIVRPNRSVTQPVAVSSGRTHTIKSGDNIWRIANKYKVSQQELLRLNKITDPTKLRIGQVIKLP
ncbi:MAG: LysM peptidoglycan-binding domain-containing protein [Luteolibacter sp.]